jgi:hypothetical protein
LIHTDQHHPKDKDVLNNVQIYTSSERRVVNTAEIFARALLGREQTGGLRKPDTEDNTPLIEHLIQRRDLLDDNNAAKELTDQAKKKLKVVSPCTAREVKANFCLQLLISLIFRCSFDPASPTNARS